MRFRRETHNYGTQRFRTEFLLFWKTIGNETRWLETATWEEEWVRGGGPGASPDFWKPLRWIGA